MQDAKYFTLPNSIMLLRFCVKYKSKHNIKNDGVELKYWKYFVGCYN